MFSCLSPSSYLTIVTLGQDQQMCAVVERWLLTDTQDLSVSDPQLLYSLEQHRVHCTGCVAEGRRGDSSKDFLGWEKVNKEVQDFSSWDPARERGLRRFCD